MAVNGEAGIRYGEPAGRWVLTATVLGSAVAFLDATVVNIALPTIGRDLETGATGLTWTINAYTLTLAAFVLVAVAQSREAIPNQTVPTMKTRRRPKRSPRDPATSTNAASVSV